MPHIPAESVFTSGDVATLFLRSFLHFTNREQMLRAASAHHGTAVDGSAGASALRTDARLKTTI
jgi:hypothetical protein